MNFNLNTNLNILSIIIVEVILLIFLNEAKPQFWKLNNLNVRDLFIQDVKSTMFAGICYKKINDKTEDPQFSLRTLSYCCTGYRKSQLSPHKLKCEPICKEECLNGICTAPDTCECYPGFIHKDGRCESYF